MYTRAVAHMGRIPQDEYWRYCDRCYFRKPLSQLRKDPKSGKYYCTTQARCYDEPSVDDLKGLGSKKGFVFR